jgi:tetratricopeptide (TPR) repeat protein
MEHPDTLRSLNLLAQVVQRLGDLKQSKALHQRAIDLTKKVLGSDHFETYNCMGQLALVLSDQGAYEQAEMLFREALKGEQNSELGPNHPITLMTL